MNLTMTMTLDGLIRALRWKGHDLAERIERGDASPIFPRTSSLGTDRAKGDDNDRRDR